MKAKKAAPSKGKTVSPAKFAKVTMGQQQAATMKMNKSKKCM
jgi:hypothetical protein